MILFQQLYLDREKDIAVDLFMEGERLYYVMRTPNHHTGNLISNLARLCGLQTDTDDRGLKVIRGEIPSYFDGDNRRMYILRLGNTKIANIYPDGRVEMKASIPAISKTLMSQTKDYRLGIEKTIVKTYIRSECKFHTDLHTHMNGNLPPDVLIAIGIIHQIRYPYYYIKKLGLSCTLEQLAKLEKKRALVEQTLGDIPLTGKHRDRRIDDYTFINFAELILGNPGCAADNILKIRNSLTIPKDGQAVFADLEKVYLYRYVFTRGKPVDNPLIGINIESLPDRDVYSYAERMRRDREDDRYRKNTLYQDTLLWIAREYRRSGITYAEISDTSLLNKAEFPSKLRQIHDIMPSVTRETGVLLRFLAGIRRTPLTIVKDHITPNDYLAENLKCLNVIAEDPYVAGCDIIGEEVNDILELREVIGEITGIAANHPGFVIRIHAGENDSLRDNVANSIRCVTEALRPGQRTPSLRIGHGLYTCDLKSAKGRQLLEDMRLSGAVLEFQITSNVRLNNLSRLEKHPLRQYLRAGIRCVQGTDGGALYGTNSIDEELSLEKLLGLTLDEMKKMREAESAILRNSLEVFAEKSAAFRDRCPGGDTELYYQRKTDAAPTGTKTLWRTEAGIITADVLKDRIGSIPEGLFPIIIAGGSFNSDRRRTSVKPEDESFITGLLDRADPDKICFIVGHTLSGQEGFLVRAAAKRFRICAIVPGRITQAEYRRLKQAGVTVILSIEDSGIGLYKSFAYEIFRKKASALIAFDGNSAALNLIQEARNGRQKCLIYINSRSRGLTAKGRMLEGYVKALQNPETILQELLKYI